MRTAVTPPAPVPIAPSSEPDIEWGAHALVRILAGTQAFMGAGARVAVPFGTRFALAIDALADQGADTTSAGDVAITTMGGALSWLWL